MGLGEIMNSAYQLLIPISESTPDFLTHPLASAGIYLASRKLLEKKNFSDRISETISIGISLTAGISKELLDYHYARSFSVTDLGYDLLGICIGAGIYHGIKKLRKDNFKKVF